MKIDLVCPLIANDLNRFKILAASLRKFWKCEGQLFVIVRPSDEKIAEEILAECPDSKIVMEDGLLQGVRGGSGTGWWIQQLLKLAAANLVESEFYLTVDADCFAVRTIRFDDLVKNGRGFLSCFGTYHPEWYSGSAKVLGWQEQFPSEIGVTPFLFHRKSVLDLIKRLEDLSANGSWTKFLMSNKGGQEEVEGGDKFVTWTEYTLYHLHLLQTGKLFEYHDVAWRGSERFYENNIWFYKNAEGWDPRRSFEQGIGSHHLFSLIHSKAGIPERWIWERIKPWLP